MAASSPTESCDDSAGLPAGPRLYPSDELINFQQKLAFLRACNYSVQGLISCLEAAWQIVAPDTEKRQTDMDAVRRFLREDLWQAVDKFLATGNNSRFWIEEEYAIDALHQLVKLAAAVLKYRQQQSPAVLQELDADIGSLVLLLMHAFNPGKPLHQRFRYTSIPQQVYEKHREDFETMANAPWPWVLPQQINPSGEDLQDDDMQQDDEENAWVTHIANIFGSQDGFDILVQMLLTPAEVGFNLMNTSSAVLAQVCEHTSEQAKQQICQVLDPITEHLLQLLANNDERLADYGADRTYNVFRCLVNINLPRIIQYCVPDDEQRERYAKVQSILRAFVDKMLDSSSFNKLLSGARECRKMLADASEKDAELWAWMQQSHIVERLLRTGLHHKQYMVEVTGVMAKLTETSQLTAEHLDLMWAVTEKEDAYDAVKTNMYDLLANVASNCQPSQLDMLFAKLERSQARSAQDTERLLTLLEKLALSDAQNNMRGKIVQLVLELTTLADAPPELLEKHSLASIMKHYMLDNTDHRDQVYCVKLINKCFKQLKDSSRGQVPLLRTAQGLLNLLDKDPKAMINCSQVVDELETKQRVVTNLVHSLCKRVSELRQKIADATAAATAAAAGGDNDAAAASADVAAIKAAALAEMQEGSWGHSAIVKETMTMLRTLASHSSSFFPDELPAQLWDALMLDPPNGEDHLFATLTFFRGGFYNYTGSIAYFEEPTRRQLLEFHLVKQDVVDMSLQAAILTWDIFTMVNGTLRSVLLDATAKPKREVVIQDLESVIGLDMVWRIYLHCKEDAVAGQYQDHMLCMYHSWEDAGEAPNFRRALVKQIVHHMREAAVKLAVPDQQEAGLAARTVARCLGLATAAVREAEEDAMPPVPEHKCAWKGTPVLLEVQREGVSRLRLSTHDNEYIGLLRERLARLMGCSAKHVRMLNMGKELQSDHDTVQSSGLRNRACLIVAERSKANDFTRSPSEYRPFFELYSYTWMLAQADGLYPLLLQFADTDVAGTEDIASMALELLAELPTHAGLSERLGAALDGPDKHQQLASLLDVSSSSMAVDSGSDKQCAPYQTLYALQTLCALLFPTFDEALLASADRDAVAEGSACPSPAAAAPGLPQQPPGAAEAPVNAADAAAVSAVQHQHHREVQQQEFLQSGGLEVVLDAAHKAAASSSSDLRLRRQLSELLVLLLHNLLDAASSWQTVPWIAAATATVLSNGPCAMSGAESGAGQPAGAARHAPPTGSQPGGNSSPVESASMPLAADAQPTGGALLPVHSNGAAEDSSAERAALSSKAPATTSETACHHPASPAMEVSSPSPGQQQQPSSKQRQRGGDLPALPAQQQPAAANGNAAGSAAGPSLASLFSEHTLKLMADTLLGVAVDTGQLWGSGTVAAATADDDTSKDVAVAREALQLLQRLLEQHPPLIQPLLLDVERPALVSSVLLSPYYSGLRRQAGELLERLVSIDANRQRLLPWLLSRLAAARSLAQQRPASCAEFYQLLSTMLTKLGNSWGMLPEQLFATANTMLDEEVAALQAMAATGPVQGPLSPNTKQQLRRRRRRQQQQQQQQLMAIDGADAGTDGEGEQLDPPSCSLLQGRLQLVLALVRVLDRRAVGSEGQGGLMKLLLQQFLFPEAVVKAAAAAGPVDLQHSAASLEPHCATPASRKAALELLAELMGDTASSLEEGVNMLLDLHYQRQVLTRFNMQPRMLRPPGQYAGVRNGGATCYMNAVFQQLFMQPSIRGRILGSAEVPGPDQEDSVFAQLQGLFAHLALSKATFASPNAFWAAFKDYDGTPIDVREHQDAYEFFTRLQDCVDQHLISTNQEPAIKPVMGGTFVQQIICRGVNYTSERNEDFYQISVEVKGMGTLQRSLDDYVKGELMEGDNAYLCEHLGKRVSAVKRTGIRTLPQMLCVHLKRFEFDYHNQTRHKLRDRFEFPQELDMFPYTAEGLAAADALQKAAEEQQQQQDGQQQPRPVRSSSGAGSAAAAAAAAQAAQGLHPDYMYDLHGIVVHSGSAFTGHYYSYIKERPGSSSGEQGPRWYCFDDKDVNVWDEGNLERDCYGGKASQDVGSTIKPPRNEYERAHSAYMLFYERRQGPGLGGVGSGSATAAAAAAQQQAAAADTDVDMAAGDASQPLPASPTAAAPTSAAPSALVATTPPPYQQQQGYSNGNVHFSIPYGMPEDLFRTVTEENIYLMWQRHVLDKHYFRFVRQLVDSRGDLGQLTTRKSRRREAAGSAGLGPGVQGMLAGAVPSGSSDRAHSSMACDPPGSHQQQQQQSLSTGSGALGMQASPSSHMAAAGGVIGVTPLDLQQQQQHPGVNAAAEAAALSPGPSSRRGEEAETVAQALMRLGVLFQFQVYLYANDALRSESNVWTEALRSLMGSGSSSTVCMQVFLELVASHPDWLQSFLMDAPFGNQGSAKQWASEMLVWTMQSATKRCSHALQAYVSACVRDCVIVGQEGPGMGQVVPLAQAQQLERALRVQLLPPLGQALIGVVEQLVLLIRSCLPRHSSSGVQISGLDLPSEPCHVLLAYIQDNPWGAAHLLQVFNIVPDLVDHFTAAAQDLNPNEIDDMGPVLTLTYELVRYASNLHQLTREQQSGQQQPPPPNPYIRTLPGSGSSPSSSGGGGGGGAGGGVHAILPAAAYAKLLQPSFLKLCVNPFVILECSRASDLGALLTWGNRDASMQLLCDAAYGYNVLKMRFPSTDGALNDLDWVRVCKRLNAAVLQHDQFVEERVNCWLMGRFERPQPAALQQQPKPHQALLSYETAISWGCLGAFKALRIAAEELFREVQTDRLRVLESIATVLAINAARVQGDFIALLEFGAKQPTIMSIGGLGALLPLLAQLLQFGGNRVYGQGQTVVRLHPHLLMGLQQQHQQQQMDEGDDLEGDEGGLEEGEAGGAGEDDDELLE